MKKGITHGDEVGAMWQDGLTDHAAKRLNGLLTTKLITKIACHADVVDCVAAAPFLRDQMIECSMVMDTLGRTPPSFGEWYIAPKALGLSQDDFGLLPRQPTGSKGAVNRDRK